jgi:hypothetical protein
MTRSVIFTVPCLPVQGIVSSFWYAVEDSNPYIEIRNLVSYSIERTAHNKLVGVLRIELRPHAPKAWMQRVTTYPDLNWWPGPESNRHLLLFSQTLRPHQLPGHLLTWWNLSELNRSLPLARRALSRMS